MNIRNFFFIWAFIACAALISGCGFSALTHRDSNPVVKDDSISLGVIGDKYRDDFTTFSTTASRRMVVVLQNKQETKICSEPSPDVGEAFATAVANAIDLKAPVEGVPLEFSNQYARSVMTQIASLLKRSQGIQLYRDAMHSLCVDRLNKWTNGPEVGPDSYNALRRHYFDQSVALIRDELPYLNELEKVDAGGSLDLGKAIKPTVDILNAVKPQSAQMDGN